MTYGATAEAKIHRLKTLPSEQLRQNVARLRVATACDLEGKRLPLAMSWAEARRMAEEGADFGGHGSTHAILTNCTEDELAAELEGCRETLGRELGREMTIFAYPNGNSDDRIVARMRRAGFRYAFSVERGYYTAAGDPLRIPRIEVSELLYSLNGCNFSWPLFEAEVLGVFEVLLLRKLRRGN